MNGLTFLTTPYLWLGLAAAALPVIIHLIRRAKVQVVPFAAMRFLQATPQRMLRWQKLKQILLLLLRVLAVVLLGFAFARPFLQDAAAVALLSKQQKAIAIVIDASASMLAGAKSERAKAAAVEVVSHAGRSDRISIVTAGATPQILLEDGNPAQARPAIAAVQPGQTPGDLREAVLAADNLLRQQAGQRDQRSAELHIVSDLQLSNSPEGVVTLASDAQGFVSEAIPAWQNVAVLAGTLDELPACRVKNFASVEQIAEVSIIAAQKTIGRQRLSLRPGEERVVQFSESHAGLGSGYFEVRAPIDDFAQDNQFFVASVPISARRVLAVSGDPQARFFVRQAFAVAGPAPFRFIEIDPNQLANVPLRDYECVLLIADARLSRNHAEQLRRFVQDGGGMLISPSSRNFPNGGSLPNEVATCNLLLADLMPAKLLQPAFASVDRHRSVRLADIDFGHPIFKLFADAANGDPGSARFFQYYATSPANSPAVSTLAAFDDGQPALLEKAFGKGKVLLWTTGLDAQWSDLPLKPIFLPLLHQVAAYLARPTVKIESLMIGQPIFLEGFEETQPVEVVLPDGSQQELPAASTSFSATKQAGIYRFRQRGREISFAVNLDRRESDPRALSPADFLARLTQSHEAAQVAGVFGNDEADELDRERAQKLWRLALLALLIILFAEGWLAKKTPR